MATGEYEHLIKPLSIGVMNWEEKGASGAPVVGPGNAKKEVWLNGRDHLEGLNFNFSWGVHNGLGEWHSGLKPHTHSYPECLFFVGLDTANVKYLGAEIECCLGVEREAYTFNEPTVIVIPAGFPHGPIATKRMFSPKGFGFFAAALDAIFNINWLGDEGSEAEPVESTGKYAHLVKSLKPGVIIERGELNLSGQSGEQKTRHDEMRRKTGFRPGPGNANHLTCMYGKDLEGLSMNVAWGFFSQPGIWHRGVEEHVHQADEVMIFLGTDPENSDYLGAEIEIALGKEHERHIFDKPSAIVCPAGLPHAPIVTRWVDKSFALILISLAGEEAISLG